VCQWIELLYLFYAGINQLLVNLNADLRGQSAIQHALAVRTALTLSNYHAFFRLYLDAPNMAAYLMDNFVERERVNAMRIMGKAYRPFIELSFVAKELGLCLSFYVECPHHKGFLDEQECRLFLDKFCDDESQQPPIFADNARCLIDSKQSQAIFGEAIRKFDKIDIKGQI
jgi:hypothetical protein